MTDTAPSWVNDGRESRAVRVTELHPGNVLLGWNGEPFDLGLVESVTREPIQSYGVEVRYRYLIKTTCGESRADGSDWRRIAAPPL